MNNQMTKEYATKTLSATIASLKLTAAEHNHLQECIRVIAAQPNPMNVPDSIPKKSALKPATPPSSN